jgi:hypothetical protein
MSIISSIAEPAIELVYISYTLQFAPFGRRENDGIGIFARDLRAMCSGGLRWMLRGYLHRDPWGRATLRRASPRQSAMPSLCWQPR